MEPLFPGEGGRTANLSVALRFGRLDTIRLDFEVIIWWAGAMSKTADALAALLGYFAKNPHALRTWSRCRE
jgi:hypothetical protein